MCGLGSLNLTADHEQAQAVRNRMERSARVWRVFPGGPHPGPVLHRGQPVPRGGPGGGADALDITSPDPG